MSDDEDPFMIVQPSEDNKKMSNYFKKQQLPTPNKCPETESNGTQSTRSSTVSHQSRRRGNASSGSKGMSSSHHQDDGFGADGFSSFSSDPAALEFSSDFGNGLEFGTGGSTSKPRGETKERRAPPRSKSSSAAVSRSQHKSSTSRSRHHETRKSASDDAFHASSDGFGNFGNDGFGNDGFPPTFGGDDGFDPFGNTKNNQSNSSGFQNSFGSFGSDDREGSQTNFFDDGFAGPNGGGDEAWKKREEWKKGARTASASSHGSQPPRSRRSRAVPQRRQSVDGDAMTVGSHGTARSTASARSRRSQGSQEDRRSRTRPTSARRRQSMDSTELKLDGLLGQEEEYEDLQQEPRERPPRSRRRASVTATRSDGNMEAALGGFTRAPPSRNRSMDENMFEQKNMLPVPPRGAPASRRSGRRASLSMATGSDMGMTADPAAMRMNYPSSAQNDRKNGRNWASDRSKNQERIMQMTKDGAATSSPMNSSAKPKSAGQLDLTFDDFDLNDASATKPKSQRKSLVAGLVGRGKKTADQEEDQGYDQRNAEGRSRGSLLDRVGGPAGSSAGRNQYADGETSYSDRIMKQKQRR